MQNAKDTFYEVLRGRLAAINPARTIVVRGLVGPGSLVEENELVSAETLPDCFRLRWTQADVATESALPLVSLTCEVEYETAGTALAGGMDRGRSLAAMDAELLTAVTNTAMRTTKMSYVAVASGGAATALSSNVWWGAPVFGSSESRGERLGRTATIAVLSYQEAGEL